MQIKDFKGLWASIEGNPVNIKYGKSTFRNKVLHSYKESLGTVKIKGGENIYIRSIKSIELIDIFAKPEVIEPEVEVVAVAPMLPENWFEKGYFILQNNFGSPWKKAVLKDKWGNVVEVAGQKMESEKQFKHVDLFNWVYEVKNRLNGSAPDYLIDDTHAAPQYFDISSNVIKQVK